MKLTDFDYALPEESIAQHPGDGLRAAGDDRRDGARLLVHEIDRDRTTHGVVRDLERWLDPGDLLVVNDTRVLPSRLFARRESGGRVELLLLEPIGEDGRVQTSLAWTWRALCRPARRVKPGERLELAEGAGFVRMLERPLEGDGQPGKVWHVVLEPVQGTGPLEEQVRGLLEQVGNTPLPPYIRREAGEEPEDREAYQTIYARRPGAVAAPTAGLHFTAELLDRLESRGVRRASVTLHVGHGTFLPVECENVREHIMHAERFELSDQTADAVNRTRSEGGRIVAVGTTSVRVLESCVDAEGVLQGQMGETRLFLYPGRRFGVVDAMLTNFHLPRSSLLMLVSAFAGRERVLGLYREAIDRGYRFFSYGDAMLLLNPGVRTHAQGACEARSYESIPSSGDSEGAVS